MSVLANRFFPYMLPALLAGLYVLLLLHGTNFITADLGRHLMNGKLFFTEWYPITTNTYSYTYPDFPVLNHHWLFGVLLYLVFLFGGFTATHLAFLIISVATFLIFFHIAERKAGVLLTSVAALLYLPLIIERTEVRPEALSYLFAGIYFLLLLKHRDETCSGKTLLVILGLLQILWVNLHIYFFLGWVLVGAFFIESIIVSGFRSVRVRVLAICLGVVLAVSFINPFELEGMLAPFMIFNEYGYRLVENQSVWFLQKVLNQPNLLFFEIMLGLLITSFIPVLMRNRKNIRPAEVIFAIGFGTAGALALRNFTIFGLFAFPLFAENIANAFPAGTFSPRILKRVCMGVILVLILLFATGEMRKIYAYPPLRLGLLPGNEGSAQFFLDHSLEGPIFNNYDIGGYLIYYLYPKEKVFVDNRPEAYPNEFFQAVYIPMQEREVVWEEQNRRFDFNAIFFSHRDYTPWAQQFLIARINDPLWAPVYVDDTVIVFLKRAEKNASIIKKFEISRERFTVTQQ